MADEKEPSLCQRCHKDPASQDVRTQKLCDECFTIYIRTRPIKRLEALRGNIKLPPSRPRASEHEPSNRTTTTQTRASAPPTYILALSGGASSLSLLHALDVHIAGMKAKTGRASYALVALHVVTHSAPHSHSAAMDRLKAAFPSVQFETISLSQSLDSWPAPPPLVAQIEHYTSLSPEERLAALRGRALSPTALADLDSALLSHALVSFAQSYGRGVVLLGSSGTRLAALTLSETAKGRGGAVVAALDEGGGPLGDGVRAYYPMRDLLRNDVVAYTSVATVGGKTLDGLLFGEEGGETGGRVRALKNTPIDALAGTYFADVERKYPGIVHNVVRTVGKLDYGSAAGGMYTGREGRRRCPCCGEVLDHSGTAGLDAGQAGQGGAAVDRSPAQGRDMCARCERDFGVDALETGPT
ncbi:hypothetical protein ANO11243_086780 [Dothideomycetidae sp. 11243]|nr:hypothetical protein ANO11243_086780 [fungal sp. No.11243]